MKKLIIGFGGVGLNFLQGQKELLGEHFALVAMSDDAKTLECCNVQNKLSIESDFEELDKYLIIAKSIVILNGLGGGSSKSLLPLILYMKKKYDLEIQVILIKPFSWEARLKKELADEVICQLDQIGIKYKIYDNNGHKIMSCLKLHKMVCKSKRLLGRWIIKFVSIFLPINAKLML